MGRANEAMVNRRMNIISRILEHTSKPSALQDVLVAISDMDYAVIGGFAVSFYSDGRRKVSFNDVDIMVAQHHALEVANRMTEQGFELLRQNDFDGKRWLVYTHGTQEVDLALAGDPLSTMGIQNARVADFRGQHSVRIIDPCALITMKVAAGREKDHRDILYVLKSGAVDVDECRAVVRRFAGHRLQEFEQLVEDSNMFDYDLLARMTDE